ncbi:hypothetical protein L4C37_22160, partial [Vibrio kagoshimensis]
YGIDSLYFLIQSLGFLYILYASVFVAVGLYFFGSKVFVKLPQWILLLPIGLLAIYGAMYV